MKNKFIISLIIIGILLISGCYFINPVRGSETLIESNNSSTFSYTCYGSRIQSQTFKVGFTNTNKCYNITSVKLIISKTGNPGDSWIYFYNVNQTNTLTSNTLPVGNYIDLIYFNGNTISTLATEYEFNFTNEFIINTNNYYAIGICCPYGNVLNNIKWYGSLTNNYNGGANCITTDNFTWICGSNDLYFYIYGKDPFNTTIQTTSYDLSHCNAQTYITYNKDTGITSSTKANADTPTFNLFQNPIHATGTHTGRWNSTTWEYSVWANYTGSTPVFENYENIINSTGIHTGVWNSTTWYYLNWANYTGNTTPITISDTKNNVTGTCTYSLQSDGYHIVSTHESTISFFENLINCTGSHFNNWNNNNWVIQNNYTGNTTPITISDTKNNVTGTCTYSLQSDGYHIVSTHESTLSFFENLINCTGSHFNNWNNNNWVIQNNYTGLGNGSIPSNQTYYINYSDNNLTFNGSINNEGLVITNSQVNTNNWLSLMGEIMLDNSQFFLTILIGFWIYFLSKYIETKYIIYAYSMFGIMIPLSIILSSISINYFFGFILVFIILIISIYIITDALYYNDNKKQNKKIRKR